MKSDKPFVELKGEPLIIRTLKSLSDAGVIDYFVVAAHPSKVTAMTELIKRFKIQKVGKVVAGGETRFESVKNALRAVSADTEIILIHDAARPFIEKETIERVISMASQRGGAIAAVPESDTVKLVGADLVIRRTLERASLWRAQTPQAFRRDVIIDAYEKSNGHGITDDASVVEAAGGRVSVVMGSYKNIKITTGDDIALSEGLI